MRLRSTYTILGLALAGTLAVACGDDTDDPTTAGPGTTSAGGGDGGNPVTTTSNGGAGGEGAGSVGGAGGEGGEGGEGGAGGTRPDGTCAAPFVIAETDSVSGDTTGASSALNATGPHIFAPACETGVSGEHVYAFTPATAGAVTITLSTTDADLGFYVRRVLCDDGLHEFVCRDAEPPGTNEEATFAVEAGETYYIVVDGYQEGEEGTYTLAVSDVTAEASCTDGLDDNGDGILVDCEDPSCASDAACAGIAAACGAATPLTPGSTQSGTTADGETAFHSWYPMCTDTAGAAADLFSYTATGDGILAVKVSSAQDHGIHVRHGCDSPAEQRECIDLMYGGTPEVAFTSVANGESYTVFVAAYEGGDEGAYDLESMFVSTTEIEPNDDHLTATPVTGTTEVGRITRVGDDDWYKVTVPAGGELIVSTSDIFAGDCAGGYIDTELELYDTDGTTSLDANDDVSGSNFCSIVSAAGLAGGDYFVRVGSSAEFCEKCTPAYTLEVSVTTP